MEIGESRCVTCARQYGGDEYGYKRCDHCRDHSHQILREFKPLPEWGNKNDYRAQTLAATASNYRLRKMVVRFHATHNDPQYQDELVRFYEHNREAVVKLRKHFGLYVGRDFWKLEQERDESVCQDLWAVYGALSRQTVGELN